MSPVTITIELHLCKKCIQMKNHRKEIHALPENKIIWTCLRCGNKEEVV